MSNWKVVFKNGTELRVKGGTEVLSAADPNNGAVILRATTGGQVSVNAAEVLYVREER